MLHEEPLVKLGCVHGLFPAGLFAQRQVCSPHLI